MRNAFVVAAGSLGILDAGGVQRAGADVGQAVKALTFELATEGRHLEGERRREDDLVVLGDAGDLVHLRREVGVGGPDIVLDAHDLTAEFFELGHEGIGVHTGVGDALTFGEHDRR